MWLFVISFEIPNSIQPGEFTPFRQLQYFSPFFVRVEAFRHFTLLIKVHLLSLYAGFYFYLRLKLLSWLLFRNGVTIKFVIIVNSYVKKKKIYYVFCCCSLSRKRQRTRSTFFVNFNCKNVAEQAIPQWTVVSYLHFCLYFQILKTHFSICLWSLKSRQYKYDIQITMLCCYFFIYGLKKGHPC